MENKKKEIESKLETLKKGLTNPQLKTNPALKKSLEKKIFDLEDELEKLEGIQQVKKPKVAQIKEKETVVKSKEKPKVVKEEKKPVISKNIKEGDTVTFFHKKSGENKKGVITSLKKSYSYADKIIVVIKTSKGEKFETYEHLVEKV